MAELYKTEKGIYEPGLRISWGSVFAGAVVALGIQMALNLLGVAMGLGLSLTENSMVSFGTGAGVLMIISAVISLFIGGWVASWASGSYRVFRGALHGAVVSGLILTTLYLTVTTGLLLGSLMGKPMVLTSLFTAQAGGWSFVAIVIGVAAACFGGWFGTSRVAAEAAVEEKERKAA